MNGIANKGIPHRVAQPYSLNRNFFFADIGIQAPIFCSNGCSCLLRWSYIYMVFIYILLLCPIYNRMVTVSLNKYPFGECRWHSIPSYQLFVYIFTVFLENTCHSTIYVPFSVSLNAERKSVHGQLCLKHNLRRYPDCSGAFYSLLKVILQNNVYCAPYSLNRPYIWFSFSRRYLLARVAFSLSIRVSNLVLNIEEEHTLDALYI